MTGGVFRGNWVEPEWRAEADATSTLRLVISYDAMAMNSPGTAPASHLFRGVPHDPLRLALFGLIVLTISRVHQAFPLVDKMHPALILTAIALGAVFLDPRLVARDWTRRWSTRVVAGIACAALGSIAFGISQGGAWWFFSTNFWKVLFTAFLLMAGTRDGRDVWFFAWAYVIACAILAWMALFLFGLSPGPDGNMRLSNLYTWDANDLGLVLLVGLPLCIFVIRTSSARARVFATVIAIGIAAAIARSGSRGAFLGLGSVLAAYLFSLKGSSLVRRFGLALALVAALAVAAPHGYWQQMHTITSYQEGYNWTTTQGRKQLAIDGLGFMVTHPLFGIGVGNFGRAEAFLSGAAQSRMAGSPGLRWSVAHNAYIGAGAEMGIPGLLLFTTLVLGCIVGSWRLKRRIPARWEYDVTERRLLFHAALYLPLAAVGFAVPAIFLSFQYHDPIYILAALTGALFSAVDVQLQRDSRQARCTPRGRRLPRPVLNRGTAGWVGENISARRQT